MIPSREVLFALLAAAVAILTLALLFGPRVALIEGRSMEPTLSPGQRVLILRPPGWRSRLRGGELVLASVPPGSSGESRLVVKRLEAVTRTARGLAAELRGDNPQMSRDSRSYGLVPLSDLRGVVVWPRGSRRWDQSEVSRRGSAPAGR